MTPGRQIAKQAARKPGFTEVFGCSGITALVIAVVMTLTMMVQTLVSAVESSQHTITITNTDQYGTHSFEAYQIFKGKLDAG